MEQLEYSASQIRKILQELFPRRRLVLSQFTFFNQVGVAKPTGVTFRRGRRCYRLEDLLSIACILALKEEGIPYKNVDQVPAILQAHAERIFASGHGCRLSGFGDIVNLVLPGEEQSNAALLDYLSEDKEPILFWSFDVGLLAEQLQAVAQRSREGQFLKAA